MTKYIFRMKLPTQVDEHVLRHELARMIYELITQHGEIQIDVSFRYELKKEEEGTI